MFIDRDTDGAIIARFAMQQYAGQEYLAGDSANFFVEMALLSAASDALKLSDITVLLCYEDGVSVPAEWVQYRKDLRLVLSGNLSELPTQPTYPTGN